MEIRSCSRKDVNEVYSLICELKNKEFDYNKFCDAFYSKVDDEKNYYYVAIEDEIVVGFISLVIDYQLHHANKVATVEELVVNSNYRKRGLGKALLDNAIDCAKENKCDTIELTSSFSREDAHRFYEKNGFTKGSYKFKMNLE